MFYKYLLEWLSLFGVGRNPLLNLEDKYTEIPEKSDIYVIDMV